MLNENALRKQLAVYKKRLKQKDSSQEEALGLGDFLDLADSIPGFGQVATSVKTNPSARDSFKLPQFLSSSNLEGLDQKIEKLERQLEELHHNEQQKQLDEYFNKLDKETQEFVKKIQDELEQYRQQLSDEYHKHLNQQELQQKQSSDPQEGLKDEIGKCQREIGRLDNEIKKDLDELKGKLREDLKEDWDEIRRQQPEKEQEVQAAKLLPENPEELVEQVFNASVEEYSKKALEKQYSDEQSGIEVTEKDLRADCERRINEYFQKKGCQVTDDQKKKLLDKMFNKAQEHKPQLFSNVLKRKEEGRKLAEYEQKLRQLETGQKEPNQEKENKKEQEEEKKRQEEEERQKEEERKKKEEEEKKQQEFEELQQQVEKSETQLQAGIEDVTKITEALLNELKKIVLGVEFEFGDLEAGLKKYSQLVELGNYTEESLKKELEQLYQTFLEKNKSQLEKLESSSNEEDQMKLVQLQERLDTAKNQLSGKVTEIQTTKKKQEEEKKKLEEARKKQEEEEKKRKEEEEKKKLEEEKKKKDEEEKKKLEEEKRKREEEKKKQQELQQKLKELQNRLKEGIKQVTDKLDQVSEESGFKVTSLKTGIEKYSKLAERKGYTIKSPEDELGKLYEAFLVENNLKSDDLESKKKLEQLQEILDGAVKPLLKEFNDIQSIKQQQKEEEKKQQKPEKPAKTPGQLLDESLDEVIRDVRKKENLDELPPRDSDDYIKELKEDIAGKYRLKLHQYYRYDMKEVPFPTVKIDSLVDEVLKVDSKYFRNIRDRRILGQKQAAGIEGLKLESSTPLELEHEEPTKTDWQKKIKELQQELDTIAPNVMKDFSTKVDSIAKGFVISKTLQISIAKYGQLANLRSEYTEESRQIKLMNLYQEFAQHPTNKKIIGELEPAKQRELEEAFYGALKLVSERVDKVSKYQEEQQKKELEEERKKKEEEKKKKEEEIEKEKEKQEKLKDQTPKVDSQKSVEELQQKSDKLQKGIGTLRTKIAEDVDQITEELPGKLKEIVPGLKVNIKIQGRIKDEYIRFAEKPEYSETLREKKLDELCKTFIETEGNQKAISAKLDELEKQQTEPKKSRETLKGELEKQLTEEFRKALDPVTAGVIQMRDYVEQQKEAEDQLKLKQTATKTTKDTKDEKNTKEEELDDEVEEKKPETEIDGSENQYKDISPHRSTPTPYRAAHSLGCTISGLKDKITEKLQAIDKALTKQDELSLKDPENYSALTEQERAKHTSQKEQYLELRGVIEKPLAYVEGINLTTPEDSSKGALRTLAASLGMDIQGREDDELKQWLEDKAIASGVEKNQAQAFVTQLQEAVQVKLLLGATEQEVSLKDLQERDLDDYLGNLKQQDADFRKRAKKGIAEPEKHGFSSYLKSSLNATSPEQERMEREKRLDKNAEKINEGLYAQVGKNGKTHYSMTQVTKGNIETIVNRSKGRGVLWRGLSEAIGNDLKAWKEVRKAA